MPRELMFLQQLARKARLYPDLFDALGEDDHIFFTASSRKHARHHAKLAPLDYEGLIMVHPFYRRVEAIALNLPDAREGYVMDNMRMAAEHASGRMPVVLIDDYPSYVLESSGLAEDGLVDHVIFTHNWDPKPERAHETNGIRSLSKAFLCGSYGRGRCLSHYFIELYRPNAESVVHIWDAILNSPRGPLIKYDTEFEMQYMDRVGITIDTFVSMAYGRGERRPSAQSASPAVS